LEPDLDLENKLNFIFFEKSEDFFNFKIGYTVLCY
jgi:hypothetical protein